ncbi:MAG: DUF1295 domain-containing protein [Bradyrhizobiaceae bacterium]|nr:MAG: DUF1295 domain-containing protein [Bradyrhizobiaceae bacterium]
MTASIFFTNAAIISAALSINMILAWLVWYVSRNSGWIDTVWTFGLGAIGACSALLLFRDEPSFRSWLVVAMALVWSARLGFHIARRTTKITDDPRYAKLINDWGHDAPRQMFCLLQKQALVSIPLGVAMWLAAQNPSPDLSLGDIVGILIFVTGVVGEAIADEQLRRFRGNPENKGRICNAGLWSLSRHPNYFFEWLGWFVYPALAINFGGNIHSWGFVAFAAPACMYWLLVYISGIPPLEEHMLERRGDEFRKYQSRTNAFFPGPPKAIAGEL